MSYFTQNRARIRRILWADQEGRCAYCHDYLLFSQTTIDHVVPRAAGGTNKRENLVVACTGCNKRKADMLPSHFALTAAASSTVPTKNTGAPEGASA